MESEFTKCLAINGKYLLILHYCNFTSYFHKFPFLGPINLFNFCTTATSRVIFTGIPNRKYVDRLIEGIHQFLRSTAEISSICLIYDFLKPLKIWAHLENCYFHCFIGGPKGKIQNACQDQLLFFSIFLPRMKQWK